MIDDPINYDNWVKRLADLRRDLAGYAPSPPATKADLDAAVARIESQMLALLAEVKRRDVKWAMEMYRLDRAAKPQRRAKRRARR